MTTNHGKFCWYQLTTPDVTAATAFYGPLLGFGTQQMPEMGDYTFWAKPDGEMLGGMSAGSPAAWLCTVAVDEVDAAVNRAREHGATVVVPPTDIPNMGRFAVLIDPQGAAFGVYAGETGRSIAGVDPSLGGVGWHELMTSDLAGAKAFYGTMFGWRETDAKDLGPEYGVYSMYGHGDTTYGGMMRLPPGVMHTEWIPYFTVADAHAIAARVPELGGRVLHGPVEVPGGGLVLTAIDPQGATFAVYANA